MNWEFNGLPLHVLLIHFVVIVVPLAGLILILGSLWPAARRRLGIVTPLVALAALISVPITVEAGEWLEERVRETALSEAHAHLGKTLLPWAIGVFVIAVAQWVWHRYVAADGARFASLGTNATIRRAVPIVIAVIAIVVVVGSVVSVFVIGESGVRSVWSELYSSTAG